MVQYTLAADRNNDAVSNYYKSSHPSILSMIKKVVSLCNEKGKRAIICGQMGSDFKMLPILVGLGVRNISVNWPVVNQLKKAVLDLEVEKSEALASSALKCYSIREVEKLLNI